MQERNNSLTRTDDEPGNPDDALKFLIDKAQSKFTKEFHLEWKNACYRLFNAGYGKIVPLSYARHSPKLIEFVNNDCIILLASSVSIAAIKTNRAAAEMLSTSAVIASKNLKSSSAFISWLKTIEEIIKFAPESLLPTLERMEKILATLDHIRFRSWVITGLRSSGDDTLRQINYFTLLDPESEKWFRHEAGDIVLTDIQRALKLYLI